MCIGIASQPETDGKNLKKTKNSQKWAESK